MTKYMNKLFPKLSTGSWGLVNLDMEARVSGRGYDLKNPYEFKLWVDCLHRNRGIDYSYGGFKENRSFLLRNHYNQEEKAFIHLGTDYTVPVQTEAALLADGLVIHVMRDKDQKGGWGGRVIFQLEEKERYLIYGHLAHEIAVEEGDHCKSGKIIGRLGEIEENGGWWPHLHMQEIDRHFFSQFLDLSKIDGYLREGHPLFDHIFNSRFRRLQR